METWIGVKEEGTMEYFWAENITAAKEVAKRRKYKEFAQIGTIYELDKDY
jgi:hypothetical protein